MNVFQNYGKYYDLLYQDKDYVGEANFLIELFKKHNIDNGARLLELGTGTGKHACHLAEQGYFVTGIEQSDIMLEIAGQALATKNTDIANRIKLYKGDIRTWDAEKENQGEQSERFDAVFSLFHVMSYMQNLADLKAVFANIKKQVKSNGVFVFDCWYGPAVLNLKPETRFKIMTDGEYTIERVAQASMDTTKQQVTIDYTLFSKDKDQENYQKFTEQHKMRFLFKSEIELLCEQFDCELTDSFEWMTKADLSQDTWGACFIITL